MRGDPPAPAVVSVKWLLTCGEARVGAATFVYVSLAPDSHKQRKYITLRLSRLLFSCHAPPAVDVAACRKTRMINERRRLVGCCIRTELFVYAFLLDAVYVLPAMRPRVFL